MRPLQNAAILTVAAIGCMASTAAHAANRFGVVCVTNKTTIAIHYRIKIGNGEWQQRTMSPNEARSFSHRYDKINENKSPDLEIDFDSDLRAQKKFNTKYRLPRQAAAGDSCKEGAQYEFRYDKANRNFIDLVKVP